MENLDPSYCIKVWKIKEVQVKVPLMFMINILKIDDLIGYFSLVKMFVKYSVK